MGNIFKIKYGESDTIPTDEQLEDREFGLNTKNQQLYLGKSSGPARKILSEDDNKIAHTNNLEIGQYTFYSDGTRLTLKKTGGSN